MSKFYAVMMSDRSIVATGESFDECSSAALKVNDWLASGDPFAPYVIQDFAPGERPEFFMINQEYVRDGVVFAGQSYGRVQRVVQ